MMIFLLYLLQFKLNAPKEGINNGVLVTIIHIQSTVNQHILYGPKPS